MKTYKPLIDCWKIRFPWFVAEDVYFKWVVYFKIWRHFYKMEKITKKDVEDKVCYDDV